MKAAECTAVSARERTVALILLGAATLLRVPYIVHYRFNTDEAQHLHVVWGWTRGLLQYRDFSDNHPPLFHLLMAPLLALLGERPDALTLMRFAMVPLALLAIGLTYFVGARLYGSRVAIWAAVLLALHYEFFLKSIEFRTDNLWTVGWLATLAVIVSGPLRIGRTVLAGAALGTNLCVSQKTALMAAALAGAAALVAALSPEFRRALRWPRIVRLAGAGAAGFLLPPLVVVGFFTLKGAFGALASGVFAQNLLPGLGAWSETWRRLLLPAGVVLAIWYAVPRLRSAGADRTMVRRALIVLTAVIYVTCLESVWPLVTGQDYLPVFPLAAILAVVGLDRWERRASGTAGAVAAHNVAPKVVLIALLAVESSIIVLKGPVWRDETAAQTALVSDVLRLTGRDEPVVDTKGETLFRTRPFLPVLETITVARLRRGLIPDTLAEDTVRARCYVAVQDSPRFPATGRAFLNENFVSVGSLRVAGRFLPAATPLASFDIAIPGPYAVVTPTGAAAGALDGTPYSGPRPLAAGTHTFAPASGSRPLAVIWGRASERGFSPFREMRDPS